MINLDLLSIFSGIAYLLRNSLIGQDEAADFIDEAAAAAEAYALSPDESLLSRIRSINASIEALKEAGGSVTDEQLNDIRAQRAAAFERLEQIRAERS